MHIKDISPVLTVTDTPQAVAINNSLCEVVCFTGILLVAVDGLPNPMVLPAGSSRTFDAAGIALSSTAGATAQYLIYNEARL